MRRHHHLAAPLAIALAATCAIAQTPDVAALFKALDKNGDGVVTQDEWLAAGRQEQGFQRIDADHDGKITLDELKAALGALARSRQPSPTSGGAASATPAPAPGPWALTAAPARFVPDGQGCSIPLREMPPGPATTAATSLGPKMFESVAAPGITDVYAATNSGVLADFDGDGRVDLLLVQSGGSPLRPAGRMRLLLNKGCLRFEEHKLDIEDAGFTADQMGLETQIANVADFNKDGFKDILLTRSRGPYDHPSIGNSLLVSDGAFDRFRDVGPKLGITNEQGYNRATAIGDLNGDGWLDFAVGADNIGNTKRLGIPRNRLYVYQPAASGKFEDGRYQDMSTTNLAPDFPGEFACNPNKDRAGPDILFRDLDGDGQLDILQSYHIDMNGSKATDLCASGEYWTGLWVWKNITAQAGHFSFQRIQGDGLAEEGRAHYDPGKQVYVADKTGMGLAYIFTADVANNGRQDVLAIGPTDPSWTVTTDPSAVRFYMNLGDFKFHDVAKTNGLAPIDWTYKQWAQFWKAPIPDKTQFDQLACTMNGLQVSICKTMTIGDYKFYLADAIMADFNNDGAIDILVADRRESDGMWGVLRNELFLGDGHGGFKLQPTEVSGIGRNCISMEAADLRNNGLLDVVCMASPYNSYPPALMGVLPPLPKDRSLNTVYLNTGAFGARANHWVELRFAGVDDSALIGATVETRDGDALLGSTQLTTAQSYKSGGELTAHFGLGKRKRVDIRVKLRTGERVFKDLPADGIYILDLKSGTFWACCQAKGGAA
jgi:hypothetical protein